MDENLIKRIPPHSREAERAVIGAMIMDGRALDSAVERLHPEDFYDGMNVLMFRALTELYRSGVGTDLVTLQNKLESMEGDGTVSNPGYIADIINSVPTSANIKYYIDIVIDKSYRRKLIAVTEDISSKAFLQKESLEELLENVEKEIFDVTQQGTPEDIESMESITVRAIDSLEQAYKNKGKVTGLRTGFRELDYRTAGLQRTDFVLIAGRPSMGKTAFALNITDNVIRAGGRIAIFSLEMGREQLVKRLMGMDARMDALRLRTGDIDENGWGRIMESARKLPNIPCG